MVWVPSINRVGIEHTVEGGMRLVGVCNKYNKITKREG